VIGLEDSIDIGSNHVFNDDLAIILNKQHNRNDTHLSYTFDLEKESSLVKGWKADVLSISEPAKVKKQEDPPDHRLSGITTKLKMKEAIVHMKLNDNLENKLGNIEEEHVLKPQKKTWQDDGELYGHNKNNSSIIKIDPMGQEGDDVNEMHNQVSSQSENNLPINSDNGIDSTESNMEGDSDEKESELIGDYNTSMGSTGSENEE